MKILSNHNATYQQRNTVSINRDKLVEIAINPNLTKKDLRVLVLLLTQLDGFTQPKVLRKDFMDPLNFKKIQYKRIAKTLNMEKRDVIDSVTNIWNEGYLEQGSNDTIEKGYRFTF